jgi:hypothetical protein
MITFIATGPISFASSRMRCYWPAQYLPGARVVQLQEADQIQCGKGDVIIWQKMVNTGLLSLFHERGAKQIWDLCDPVYWWQPKESTQILGYMERVVLSSPGLKNDFDKWSEHSLQSMVIPDRLKMSHFPLRREHIQSRPTRLIWYGIMNNRMALWGTVPTLERLVANGYPIELTVCDDRPDVEWQITQAFPMYNVRWSLEQENKILASHDIALLPPYPGAWGTVKSNNKKLTAYASGLPVTNGFDYDELKWMMRPEVRRDVASEGLDQVLTQYQVQQSAIEWGALCESL